MTADKDDVSVIELNLIGGEDDHSDIESREKINILV